MYVKNLKVFKENIRAKYKDIRKNMVPEKKKIMDAQIMYKLFLLDKFEKSKTVLTYVSKDIEVPTYKIMQESWRRRKRVAVPKCDNQNKRMDFYYIDSLNDLEKGTFGIYEPCVTEHRVMDMSQGICIVPGFCFDSFGYRIGYGKGYYDRFLPNFKGFTIGLCYSNCLNFKLPRGRYDRPVDILITDKHIKRIYKPRRQIYGMKGKFSGSKVY